MIDVIKIINEYSKKECYIEVLTLFIKNNDKLTQLMTLARLL